MVKNKWYKRPSMNSWKLIPDPLKDDPVQLSHSPSLVAVINIELYSLEASSNQLKPEDVLEQDK